MGSKLNEKKHISWKKSIFKFSSKIFNFSLAYDANKKKLRKNHTDEGKKILSSVLKSCNFRFVSVAKSERWQNRQLKSR
jgi:hypothetical protein